MVGDCLDRHPEPVSGCRSPCADGRPAAQRVLKQVQPDEIGRPANLFATLGRNRGEAISGAFGGLKAGYLARLGMTMAESDPWP